MNNKNKRLSKIMLAAVMATAIVSGNIPTISNFVTAYAAEQPVIKTATLNNVKVSFNGAEPVVVQAYNIDGYNYVRARDITNGLDMKVAPIGKRLVDVEVGNPIEVEGVGIIITPDEKADSAGAMETLTQQTITVNLVDGEISYSNMLLGVKCFNYADRYYFKVADIGTISQNRREALINLTKNYAEAGIRTSPSQDSFDSVNVSWNATTETISVSRETTDLWAVFNGNGGTATATTTTQSSDTEELRWNGLTLEELVETSTLSEYQVRQGWAMHFGTWTPIVPTFEKQAPLTAAPTVGTRLANILVDESKGAYLEDGTVDIDNLTANYSYNTLTTIVGQCTWYAEGRFTETTGVDSRTNKYWTGTGSVSDWLENVATNNCPDVEAIYDINDIRPYSIAIFKGHAAFVEYVEYDSNGMPINVYYTEANTDHALNNLEAGKYYPEHDCFVKARTWEQWLSKGNGTLKGYIVAK